MKHIFFVHIIIDLDLSINENLKFVFKKLIKKMKNS